MLLCSIALQLADPRANSRIPASHALNDSACMLQALLGMLMTLNLLGAHESRPTSLGREQPLKFVRGAWSYRFTGRLNRAEITSK